MATSIYFVLDRSGSMYSCIDDTIGGFNAFVSKQKKDNPDGMMNLFLFNDTVDLKYSEPIRNVSLLNEETYFPVGPTALCDAIGRAIKSAEKDNAVKPIVVILTDGFENSSKAYTQNHINDLIEIKKKDHNWQFVFLAANQDAIQTAQKFGIGHNAAMTFGQDCVSEAFDGLSAAIGRQVTGETQDIEFSNMERQASCAPPSPKSTSEVFLPRC